MADYNLVVNEVPTYNLTVADGTTTQSLSVTDGVKLNLNLNGSVGPTGPANVLTIGTVTSGLTAGATITGTSPSQTLSLVLPKGDAATISVGTVTTGAAGSSVTVTNSGTTAAAVFNFSIPRGTTGATGATGAAGVGVPTGGTAGQALTKVDGTNYNTQWTTVTATGVVAPTPNTIVQRGATGSGSFNTSVSIGSLPYGTASLLLGNDQDGSPEKEVTPEIIFKPDQFNANELRVFNSDGGLGIGAIGFGNTTIDSPSNNNAAALISFDLITEPRTYQFPNESGTVALDSTAVMLTGDQSIGGLKTFSGSTIFEDQVNFYADIFSPSVFTSSIYPTGANIYLEGDINFTNGAELADGSSWVISGGINSRFRLIRGSFYADLIATSTLTADRTYTFPDVSGTVALTGNTAGIPDALTLANSKTTPVDADATVIFDSAASNAAKKLTFGNLWTWTSTKLNAYTATGAWSFSSTTRPTSSGSGLPATDSLLTLTDNQLFTARDHTTHFLNFAMSSTSVTLSATSSSSRGYWQLFTSTTASCKAQCLFDIPALCFQSTQLNFARRMIVKTRLTSTIRAGLQFYFQLGRTIGVNTSAQLDKKGFGFGITGSTVTPFVHNGTSITTTLATGSTFSIASYPQVMLDFRPAVSLDIYGIASSSTTPVLLATITTGLPTGTSTAGDGQLEHIVYDTGSGGANNWIYIGQSSITVL